LLWNIITSDYAQNSMNMYIIVQHKEKREGESCFSSANSPKRNSLFSQKVSQPKVYIRKIWLLSEINAIGLQNKSTNICHIFNWIPTLVLHYCIRKNKSFYKSIKKTSACLHLSRDGFFIFLDRSIGLNTTGSRFLKGLCHQLNIFLEGLYN